MIATATPIEFTLAFRHYWNKFSTNTVDWLANEFHKAEVCTAPPFPVKDRRTTVYTIADLPGWYFITTPSDSGVGITVVTARYREDEAPAEVEWDQQPEGMRAFDLEQWVYHQQRVCASTRATYPECRIACHSRELFLKGVLAVAKKQKVEDQHAASLKRTPREEFERGRQKERKLILEYIDRLEASPTSSVYNAPLLRQIRSEIAAGKHSA